MYAFGAYDPAGKRFLYEVHLRKRCGEFKGFLQHLLQQISGKLYLVLDNVRTHTAACIQAFVKAHEDRLELLPIPSRPNTTSPLSESGAQPKREFVAMTALATCQSCCAKSGRA